MRSPGRRGELADYSFPRISRPSAQSCAPGWPRQYCPRQWSAGAFGVSGETRDCQNYPYAHGPHPRAWTPYGRSQGARRGDPLDHRRSRPAGRLRSGPTPSPRRSAWVQLLARRRIARSRCGGIARPAASDPRFRAERVLRVAFAGLSAYVVLRFSSLRLALRYGRVRLRSKNALETADEFHDRRNRAKGRADAIRLGQPDLAARSHDPDLGRTFDRRPIGRRPDRTDDPDHLAVGPGAGSDPDRRAPHAAAGLANSARSLAIYGRDGRARLHRVQRALLRRRASHQRAQSVHYPGRHAGAGADRRAPVSGRTVLRAAGAWRIDDHARRRGDRRPGRPGAARRAGVQRGRRHDIHSGRPLCGVHDRVARAAAGFRLEPARRHGGRCVRDVRAADDLGDRHRADSSGRPRRGSLRSSMWPSARRSSRRSSSCAASN